MSAQRFHALLIGADFYFPNQLPSGARFERLTACVGDVARVEATLRAHLTTAPIVRKLLASNVPGASEPPEKPCLWPTFDNIKRELDALVREAGPGDQVLIYYSGHGGRVLTRFAALKKPVRHDETLVPIDIGDTSVRHLRDLDLAHYIEAMAANQVLITLVIDGCHSGGVTRAPGIEVRQATGGADIVDTTERPAGGVASDERLEQAWEKLAGAARSASGSSLRGAAPAKGLLPDAPAYVLLAACGEHEVALAAALDGKTKVGVMTEAFLDALRRTEPGETWNSLYDRVLARVHARFRSQTPQLVGEVGREVFGKQIRPVLAAMTVAEVDPEGRRVKLDGGLALGVREGVEIGIYRRDTADLSRTEARVATATVASAAATEAWATLDASASIAAIEPGAPAVLLGLPVRHKVYLVRGDTAFGAALDALSDAIRRKGRGFLETVGEDEAADFQVALDAGGSYEIREGDGSPVPHVERTRAGAAGAAERVVELLVRLGKYRAILGILEPSRPPELRFRVELLLVGHKGSPPMPTPLPLSPSGDTFYLDVGAVLQIQITNDSPYALHFAVMDLTCDFGIEPLMPAAKSGDRYVTIPSKGSKRSEPIELWVPDSMESTLDVFKTFATTRHTNFQQMKLPTIHEPLPAPVATRGAAATPLERLMRALDDGSATTRGGPAAAATGDEWAVHHLRVLVRRPKTGAPGSSPPLHPLR